MKLDQHKGHLHNAFFQQQRYYVETRAGNKVFAKPNQAPSRGQLLAWQVQGTVADILNAACLEIIDKEPEKNWRLLYTIHDGVYVAANVTDYESLWMIMTNAASKYDVRINAKVEKYSQPA